MFSRLHDSRPAPGRTGFTLIELILVMLVIAVMSALIAPSLVAFATNRSNDNAATMILALSGYARAQAINDGRTYRLNFDPSGSAVWLTAADGAVFNPPDGNYGQRFQLSNGATVKLDLPPHTDGQYMEFESSGRNDPAKIWVTNQNGGTIELASDSPTEMLQIVPAAEMTR